MSSLFYYIYLVVVFGFTITLALTVPTIKYYTKMTVYTVHAVLAATFIPIVFFITRPRDYRNAL